MDFRSRLGLSALQFVSDRTAVIACALHLIRCLRLCHRLKPQLAHWLVEAGKGVTIIPLGQHLIEAALGQDVGLQKVIDAADHHGATPRRSSSPRKGSRIATLRTKTAPATINQCGYCS